jgi:cytochrome c553
MQIPNRFSHRARRALVLFLPSLLATAQLAAATPAQRELERVLVLTPDATRGAALYARCVTCHGRDGGGVVAGTVPRIAGQHYSVLVRQIVDYRHGRRWDMRMEAVAKSHMTLADEREIADVAAYVSSLPRDGSRGIGDGTHIGRGGALYAGMCERCHGAAGEGDERKAIPRIGGQHASYLMRQIYDAVDGRRPPLERTHRRRFEPLSFEEVLGVSDYVARMGWNAPVVSREWPRTPEPDTH